MTTITISPVNAVPTGVSYRAIGRERQSTGPTPGSALDALTAQLDPETVGPVFVIIGPRSDEFFTDQQVRRLKELMAKHRAAVDRNVPLTGIDRAELEGLIDAETEASGLRVAAMARQACP